MIISSKSTINICLAVLPIGSQPDTAKLRLPLGYYILSNNKIQTKKNKKFMINNKSLNILHCFIKFP
jgi:hypothetical protein